MTEQQRRRPRRGVETGLRTAAVWATVSDLVTQRQQELGRPLRVLDLGGGTGGLAVPLALAGHEVIAEHYFRAVYDRAAMLATALAQTGGILADADDDGY